MYINKLKIESLSLENMKKLATSLVLMTSSWQMINWKSENFLSELPFKWECSFSIQYFNKLIGFCIASKKEDNSFYIHLLFVDQNERQEGFGLVMLNEAKRRANLMNLPSMLLRCPKNNTKAKRFYLRYGFICEDVIQDEVSGPDGDYIMRYSLST
jgi:ribosomal protein S18 acetylase RimI-like enzyme